MLGGIFQFTKNFKTVLNRGNELVYNTGEDLRSSESLFQGLFRLVPKKQNFDDYSTIILDVLLKSPKL